MYLFMNKEFRKAHSSFKNALQLQTQKTVGCEPRHHGTNKGLAASHGLQASCDLIVAKSANLDVDPSLPADRLHPYLAASLKLWL